MTEADGRQNLTAVFRPQSVALIGASRDPDSMSGVLLQNLQRSFSGPIYPINPHTDCIGNLTTLSCIAEVPQPVDLVFIAVPAATVPSVLAECAGAGVKSIVLISAGFSETGEDGHRRQAELLEFVHETGMVLVGPNCMGVINTDPECPLNGSFGPGLPDRGNVAVCTQSGALGFVFPDYIQQWNIGISTFASVGNKIAIGENDLLRYWAEDPATDVIQLYLESFQDPAEFRRIAAAVTPHKPILALKSGRTESGSRAASSHTAALASRDTAVDALLKQSGVIRTDTLQQLFELTAVLACQPIPGGRRVAVLSDAGGPGILCVDALESDGLSVPEFSTDLQRRLREFLRPETTVCNPVDLIGSTDPNEYRTCLNFLLESDEIDSIIVIYVARLAETSELVARAVRETAETHAAKKTVLGVFMRSSGQPHQLVTPAFRIPSFLYPESAAGALARVVQFAESRNEPSGRVHDGQDTDVAEAQLVVRTDPHGREPKDGWLDPLSVERLLQVCGLPAPPSEVAESVEAAVAAFHRIGGPVALKVIAPSVLHKSDVGGVAVDLRHEDAVAQIFERMMKSINGATGVLVQEFVDGGHEIMIGMVRDSQFGPQIAFGAGGTLVEILDDVAIRLAPLTDRDIDVMISETRAGRILTHGFRERKQGDIVAIHDALARVSSMASKIPELLELDLNPIKVLSPGTGLRIVDARIRSTIRP